MKRFTFLVTIGSLLLFSACGANEDATQSGENFNQSSENPSNLIRRIEEARQQKTLDAEQRTAGLELRLVETETDEVEIEIWLKNETKQPITSVRSFLTYDPEVLQGEEITIPSGSPFVVAAPGEHEFDPDRGLVKIGISTGEGKVMVNEEMHIATVRFSSLEKTFTTIDFYNLGSGGHTLVLAKFADGFRDILQTPSVPTILFLEQ